MTTAAAPPPTRRRRRSQQSPSAPWQRFYRSPAMLACAGVASLIVLAGSLLLFSGALAEYAGVVMGWGRADVVYGFGPPAAAARTDQGEVLRHDRGGVVIETLIGADGVAAIRCSGRSGSGACPAILGVAGGQSEGEVWRRLGQPSRIRYAGGEKALVYDDIGLTLSLRRFNVVAIEVTRPRAGSVSFLSRWIRATLP